MILKEGFEKFRKQQEKINKLEARVKKLQTQAKIEESKPAAHWITAILEPFAKVMAAHLEKQRWEIMGPFGLNNETSIWFYNTPAERKEANVDSLTFRPDFSYTRPEENTNPFGVKVVDRKEKTDRYPAKSLGALNGGNNVCVVPPVGADLDWFKQYVDFAKDHK